MLSETPFDAEKFMRFFWLPILLLAGLSACSASQNKPRYQFGVSADRPIAATPASGQETQALLAWKAKQLCTLGYRVVKQDTMGADQGKQIVDNEIQCNAYHPSFEPEASLFDISLPQ